MKISKIYGDLGENLAEEYLLKRGYTLLERNFHTRYGEIDRIFLKEDSIIFVEVKARKNNDYGYPSDFVTPQKQHKIIQTAEIYMEKFGFYDYQPIFDVIEVFLKEDVVIEHIENAFP